MTVTTHRVLQVLAGLTVLICGLGIIDTMVSMKYEVGDAACISEIDDRNLCHTLHLHWLGLIGAVVLIVALALVETKAAKLKQ